MKLFQFLLFISLFLSCKQATKDDLQSSQNLYAASSPTKTSVIILGTVQDAGSPHIACKKDCCKSLFLNPDKNRKVVSLGLIDSENNKKYLFEATPNIPEQLKILKNSFPSNNEEIPDGIFLTHAHIGHYTGLMYLGKEAMNADKVLTYAMPKMKAFLEGNGPWSQLVHNQNISIQELNNQTEVVLSEGLKVKPFLVPHRDEYSETVGYKIIGPNKSLLFIPDIDKWEKWDANIIDEIANVDYAFLDASFYDGLEINNRDITEIPHPFIIESMALFYDLPIEEKNKIHFIHFNHTNPALNEKSQQTAVILQNGFKVAKINDVIEL